MVSHRRAAATVALAALTAATIFGPAVPVAATFEPTTVVPVATATGELSDSGARAFADLSACIAENGSLLAAVVVDESGSLQRTDPGDERVGAVQAAIDALAVLESSADEVRVEANLAVFGSRYDELVGWGSPSGEHGAVLLEATSAELPRHDRAQLTDYREALRGAQSAIDERRSETDEPTCGAILWFTDGKLDVGDEGVGERSTAAREELCAAQGVVDSVRGAGTSVIALALFTEEAGGSVTEADREQLRALAEGVAADGVTCGTAPIPTTAASGAYLRADQPDALRRLFSGAGALIQGGTPAESVACPGDGCVGGMLTVPVDPAVASYRVIFETTDGAAPVALVAPDGTETVVAEGAVDLPSARVVTSTRSGLFVTDVTPTNEAARGEWRVLTDPARVTIIDLYYFWGTQLAVEAPAGLVVGQQNEVVVTPRRTDGRAVDPTQLASLTVDVLVDGVVATPQPREDGSVVVGVDLTGDSAPAEIKLQATARATSAPSGTALGPVATTTRLTTQLPPSYPTLAPTRLDLGRLVGAEPAMATLTLTGSDRGDTRACFAADDLTGPPDAGGLSLEVPDCVDVPANGTVDVDVSLRSEHPADGAVSGSMTVRLTGVDAAEAVALDVPISSTMVRPVDEGTRWALVGGLLLLGLLLAAGVALLGRHLSDRYPLGPDLRSVSVPVVVGPSGIRRRDRGELLRLEDFEPLRVPGRAARFSARELSFDRRWSPWPWSPLRGRVRATSGAIVVTDGKHGRSLDPAATAAPVDFPGTQQLYLVVGAEEEQDERAEEAGAVQARLVLLADAPRGIQPVIGAWTTRLRAYEQWPDVLATIHDARSARAAASVAPVHRDEGGRSAPPPGTPSVPAADDSREDDPPSLFGPPRVSARQTGAVPEPPSSPRSVHVAPKPSAPASTDDGPPPSLF
jgi:hypothetical protein